jgi:hypothetical protein
MMGKKRTHEQALRTLLDERLETGDANRLTEYLVSNSNLPGPRANLELAAAFMDVVEGYSELESDRLWELCAQMAQVPVDAAPVNDPQEFIPFCGTVGIGAIGSVSPEFLDQALATLKRLANDPRWRMREAVRMGLQRAMSMREQAAWDGLGKWIPEGSLLEMRTAAAAVAEPALLKDRDNARLALEMHRDILERVLQSRERKSEDFRVLRKALGYTLSIVVHAHPQDGFEFMAQLAESRDLDVRWIVRENLKKNRLVKNYPEQVAAINKTLQ